MAATTESSGYQHHAYGTQPDGPGSAPSQPLDTSHHDGGGLDPTFHNSNVDQSPAYDQHQHPITDEARYSGVSNEEQAQPGRFDSEKGGHPSTARETERSHSAFGSFLRTFYTPNQLAWLAISLIQNIVVLVMIIIVFAKIASNVKEFNPQLRSIDVYLSIFIFAAVFEWIISIDALRLKNTIQLLGIIFFNIAMMIYAALMGGQIHDALSSSNYPCVNDEDPNLTCYAINSLYGVIRRFVIVIPVIIGVATLGLIWLTWRLYLEFGWDVYKKIGANLETKRMYAIYQVFVCLLKFDAFFFIGFTMQYIILVLSASSAEFVITIIALPITLIFLLVAAVTVRMEFVPLMFAFFLAQSAGMAYFIYKLVRLFEPSQAYRYAVSRKTLATFSIISLLILALTFAVSVMCYLNFGKGLKEQIPPYWTQKQKRRSEQPDLNGEKAPADGLETSGTRISLE